MRVGVWLLSPSQGGLFLSIPTSKVIDNYEHLFSRATAGDTVQLCRLTSRRMDGLVSGSG
jgi:hypothetical protein